MLRGGLFLLNLTYIMCTSKALSLFACAPGEGDVKYLRAYPPMECYHGAHVGLMVAGVVAILAYTVGFPLTVFFELRRYFRNLFFTLAPAPASGLLL